MQRLTRLVPLAVALTLVAGAGAIAPAYAQGSQQKAQQHQQMMPMSATSSKYMLDHAYQEAIRAHEAAALGMNDMATNHLENVRLTIAMLEEPNSGLNANMRQQLDAIRESVARIELPNDRAQASRDTEQVVSQFVAFYSRAPQAMGGGGGAAVQPGMGATAFDQSANATSEAANVQTSVFERDWAGAEQHAKNLVAHLDKAIKASESGAHKLDAALVKDLKSIRQDASQIVTHTRNKNQQAAQSAGKVVGRLGGVTPKIATNLEKQQGGGAGKKPMR